MTKKRLSTAEKKARAAKRKARAVKKRGTGGRHAAGADPAALRAMLGGAGLEPITPELIEEMVRSGAWTPVEADNARTLAAQGFEYHRGRNSFFGPNEFGDGAFGDIDEYDEEDDDEVLVDDEDVVHDPDAHAAELGRRLGVLAEAPSGEGTVSFDEAVARVGAAKAANLAAYTFVPRRTRGVTVGGELHIVHYAPESEDEPAEYSPVYVTYAAGLFGDESVGEEDGYEVSAAPPAIRGARFRLTEHYEAGITDWVPEYTLSLLSGVPMDEVRRRFD